MSEPTTTEILKAITDLAAYVTGLKADIKAVDTKLSTKIDAVDAKLSAKIDAVDAKLSSKIDAVDAKIEEVRRVTSVNHHKTIGRVDQVASMLAEHMTDTEAHPPSHRRMA